MRIGLATAILVALLSTAYAEDGLPLARQGEARQPFQDAEKHDLSGFLGISTGNIAGKKLKDIVTEEATNRVIVLSNHTSAPSFIHLVRAARLIESNPTIEPMWKEDDKLSPFFAVLLGDESGRFVGLLFLLERDETELVKVVSEAGVGVVRNVAAEKNDGAGLTSWNQPHGSPTVLQPPIRLDELLVWRDGSSLGFKLSDAESHRLAFCVDGKVNSLATGYFFLNVTHPDQSGGQKLDPGSDTEKILISYLKSWLADNFTEEQRTGILKTQDVGKLTKPEFNAWYVLRLVENRANVVAAVRSNRANEQADATTRPAMETRAAMEKALREKDVPVSFFGKLIDQHDSPVEGATVTIGLTQYDPQGALMFQGVRKVVTRTDKDGFFSLKDERGWKLAINDISKDGYECVPTERTRFGPFDYARNYVNRHIPDKMSPVVFHLRKRGPTTFLLEGPDLLKRIVVRPDSKDVLVELSKDPNYYWPDNRELCAGIPGLAVSASLDRNTRDWVLTFKGKHGGDHVLLLDQFIYEAPEQGYKPSAELRIHLQKNPVPGRGPAYPHETEACLIVRTTNPETFTRVGLEICPRQEEYCDINYKITVNPYGDRGFEYASEIEKHRQLWEQLRKEAVHGLCTGQLPPKPDIPKLMRSTH